MNWLLIVVILVICGAAAWGYFTGFLREIYSLAKWILILLFVFFSLPFIENVIANHTGIPAKIEESCLKNFKEMGTQMGEHASEELAVPGDYMTFLPAVLAEKLSDGGALADEALEQSGVYAGLAKQVSQMAVKGLAYLIALVAGIIIFQAIGFLLHIIEKIPVLKGINSTFGAVVGVIKGFLYVWLVFALVAAAAGTKQGMFLYSYIAEAPVLTWLYENNPILLFFLSLF